MVLAAAGSTGVLLLLMTPCHTDGGKSRPCDRAGAGGAANKQYLTACCRACGRVSHPPTVWRLLLTLVLSKNPAVYYYYLMMTVVLRRTSPLLQQGVSCGIIVRAYTRYSGGWFITPIIISAVPCVVALGDVRKQTAVVARWCRCGSRGKGWLLVRDASAAARQTDHSLLASACGL